MPFGQRAYLHVIALADASEAIATARANFWSKMTVGLAKSRAHIPPEPFIEAQKAVLEPYLPKITDEMKKKGCRT